MEIPVFSSLASAAIGLRTHCALSCKNGGIAIPFLLESAQLGGWGGGLVSYPDQELWSGYETRSNPRNKLIAP